MTPVLLVVGLGFAITGLVTARRCAARGHGRLSATFDLLIATAALADAGMVLAGGVARVVLWGLASLCLVIAALVAVRGAALDSDGSTVHRPG